MKSESPSLSARTPSADVGAAVPSDVEQAYERICGAIMDHSLPPETRLIESKLCEIFSLGRTRVRQVLQRLANERLVTLMPNRGAVVCKPGTQEALDVFEARRLIEPGIVAKSLGGAGDGDMDRLRQHLEREKLAWQQRDRRAMIRLSGEFHLLLAEIAGNATLLAMLRELVSRSSLIVAVYQSPGAANCPPDDHEALYRALLARDAQAPQLMAEHLDHVLDDLSLDPSANPGVDLHQVLGRALTAS